MDIRNIQDGTSFPRTRLLGKHELHNMMAKYGIASKERLSSIDAVSVELLIEPYNEKLNKNMHIEEMQSYEEVRGYEEVQYIFQVTESQSVKKLKKEQNTLNSMKTINQQIQHQLEKYNGIPGKEVRKALNLMRQAAKILEKNEKSSNNVRSITEKTKPSPTKKI